MAGIVITPGASTTTNIPAPLSNYLGDYSDLATILALPRVAGNYADYKQFGESDIQYYYDAGDDEWKPRNNDFKGYYDNLEAVAADNPDPLTTYRATNAANKKINYVVFQGQWIEEPTVLDAAYLEYYVENEINGIPAPVTDIEIQDKDGVTQFQSQNLKIEGLDIDNANKKLTNIALTPKTVFIDTVLGVDSAGILLREDKPFKTLTAAINALPNDDGSEWVIKFIDSNVTRDINSLFNRKIKIECSTNGVFDLSNIVGLQTSVSFSFNVPFSDVVHLSNTPISIVTYNPIDVVCNKFNWQSPQANGSTVAIFTTNNESHSIVCNQFIQRNLNSAVLRNGNINCKVFDTTASNLSRYKINLTCPILVINGQNLFFQGQSGSVSGFPFSEIRGSGTLSMGSKNIDVTNLEVNSQITISVGTGILSGSTGPLFNGVIKIPRSGIKIHNFVGRVVNSGNSTGHDPKTVEIVNSKIFVENHLFTYRKNNAVDNEDLRFTNVEVIQDNPTALINFISTVDSVNNPTIKKTGFLRSNATSIGNNFIVTDTGLNDY